MIKVTFLGAGSTVFVKNLIGDLMLLKDMDNVHVALYDINASRLNESKTMLEVLNKNLTSNKFKITAHLGIENRKKALNNADFVINAIQVGGYKPSTVIDFKIPKKYGLEQVVGDTLGIGGIFRGLRTLNVIFEFAKEIEKVCPDTWFLNYTNPMAIITGGLNRGTSIKTVGLCHSVQVCAILLLNGLSIPYDQDTLQWYIAGINHMSWLLKVSDKNGDLYPQIKKKALTILEKALENKDPNYHSDLVRFEVMRRFGYYITESSQHLAEYLPYFIKKNYPELITDYGIKIGHYLNVCENQIEGWKKRYHEFVKNPELGHSLSLEYGAHIIKAISTNSHYEAHGNVLNTGLIPNLPSKAIVEVPCLINRNGVQGTYVGELPEQLAALNRSNINVQLMTIEAALTLKKEKIYQAAYLDPHTSAELSFDDIVKMCDELIKAHGNMLPKFS